MRSLILLCLLSACANETPFYGGDQYDANVEVVIDFPEEPTTHLLTVISADLADSASTFVVFGGLEDDSYAGDACITATAWGTDEPYWAVACPFVLDGSFTFDIWAEEWSDAYIVESFSWAEEAIEELSAMRGVVTLEADNADLTFRIEVL